MKRNQDRSNNQLRDITIEPNINIHAEGSVLISFGNFYNHFLLLHSGNARGENAFVRW